MRFLYLALGLGLAAYCLVVLISKDALIETIAILGTGALALVTASLFGLWIKERGEEDDGTTG